MAIQAVGPAVNRLIAVASAFALLCGGLGASAAAETGGKLRHGYVDMRYGQLHYSIAQPVGGGGNRTPIVLFHQSPNSSVEYDALVTELGKDRVAIAPDTPGHGGSDGPETIPTIEDYVGAVVEGLEKLGYGPKRQIDVFGFHTGSRIATELAVSHPKMVRRVILGLSPYALIDDALSKKLGDEVYHAKSAADMLGRFCKSLPDRIERADKGGFPDPAWGRIAVDSMRPTVRQEFGHSAAYEYGPRFKTRVVQLTQPVQLLVVDDPADKYQSGKTAADMSRQLKAMLTKAKSVELLDDNFHNNAFYVRAKDIAAGFRKFADAPG